MNSFYNSITAATFLGIAIALTFLMFYLWKFPYDKENHRSSAPPYLVKLHRLLGYVYVLIYLYLMWQMVPRLWAYQIELPARSVFHLTLGMSIGAILIVKIAIVRFFRHMEAKLVPFLGVGLLVCTMLLVFLALPFSLREVYLSATALQGDDQMTQERIERVRAQLPIAGIEDNDIVDELSTRASLQSGRQVLMSKCTQCHDLRTVLARPRTPQSWKQTVDRMSSRSTVLNPISEQDALQVTAYLIAISPTLQETLLTRRKQQMAASKSQQSSMKMAKKMMQGEADDMPYDVGQARVTFEQRCSQCHAVTHIENAPPEDEEEANMLVQRMIGNGLIVNDQELVDIVRYISETYGGGDDANDNQDTKKDSESKTNPHQQAAPDGLDGEALFVEKSCAGCHGQEGRTPLVETYPKLAGQSKTYLAQQIRDIRSGERSSGLSSIMQGVASNLGDDEIDAISDYLSRLEL